MAKGGASQGGSRGQSYYEFENWWVVLRHEAEEVLGLLSQSRRFSPQRETWVTTRLCGVHWHSDQDMVKTRSIKTTDFERKGSSVCGQQLQRTHKPSYLETARSKSALRLSSSSSDNRRNQRCKGLTAIFVRKLVQRDVLDLR